MNCVMLIGRLTRDCELQILTDGKAVMKFTVAVDNFKKGEADFIRCTYFSKTEKLADFLKKGCRVGIGGRIDTGSYEKDGKRIYYTDVIAEKLELLESKND